VYNSAKKLLASNLNNWKGKKRKKGEERKMLLKRRE
jgi:hypothetical protein